MNIIFLTMSHLTEVRTSGIYSDLMRKFRDEGHEVYIVSPRERRTGEQTRLYEVGGVHVLGVRTLNLQKTNVIEKGIGQVLVETQFKQAIKRHLSNVKFDLVLYSTPPITFQFGVFKFPAGVNNTDTLYFQPVATKSNDGRMMLLTGQG